MPANAYLTATLGAAWLDWESEQLALNSNFYLGLGANLDLGKEWWVSNNWAIGVAGRFWFTYLDDGASAYRLLSFTLQFSATYN